jgi:hypothetical protein
LLTPPFIYRDKYQGDLSKDQVLKKMSEINQAYEVLSNEELRTRFDNGDDPNVRGVILFVSVPAKVSPRFRNRIHKVAVVEEILLPDSLVDSQEGLPLVAVDLGSNSDRSVLYFEALRFPHLLGNFVQRLSVCFSTAIKLNTQLDIKRRSKKSVHQTSFCTFYISNIRIEPHYGSPFLINEEDDDAFWNLMPPEPRLNENPSSRLCAGLWLDSRGGPPPRPRPRPLESPSLSLLKFTFLRARDKRSGETSPFASSIWRTRRAAKESWVGRRRVYALPIVPARPVRPIR